MSFLLRRVDPKRRDDLVREISLALQKADIADSLKLKLQHASRCEGKS